MADFTKRTTPDAAADPADAESRTTGSLRASNWECEDRYWREQYAQRPYATSDRGYEFYQPAYRYGRESSFAYAHRAWDDELEALLARGWDEARGDSPASWDQARDAVRDAYEHACR